MAHSHELKKGNIEDKVFSILESECNEYEKQKLEIYELPDIFCISDTVTYDLGKNLHFGEDEDEEMEEIMAEMKTDAVISFGYNAHWVDEGDPFILDGTIHGTFITNVMRKLAYFDPNIRNLTQYFQETDIAGSSIGRISFFPIDIDQELITNNFESDGSENNLWNEWGKEL